MKLSDLRLPNASFLYYVMGGNWNPVPIFNPAPGWHHVLYCNNMSQMWRGVTWNGRTEDVRGANYFVLPAPERGFACSGHFDPRSHRFQAWFGCYVLAPDDRGRRREPDSALIAALATRDNNAWHRKMGWPADDWRSENTITPITGDDAGNPRWKIRHVGHGRIDAGDQNPGGVFPDMIDVPRECWQDGVESYQERTELSHGDFYYLGDVLIMEYRIGVEFTNRAGQRICTEEDLRPEFEAMRSTVRFYDDGGGWRCAENMPWSRDGGFP